MQVYVQKSTTTTRPRRPSVVSGGELSHPVAPPSDGILPSAGRRPGAQPAPRTARSIASSNDESCSISSPSNQVGGVAGGGPSWSATAAGGTPPGAPRRTPPAPPRRRSG